MTSAGKLARNTIFMYIRMIILMLIGFYTSRVLLRELGIVDFGIYGIVGSIIAMFGSLRGLFVTSTQRFLNYEMGRGNLLKLKLVFNTSIIVNFFISVFFAIAVELLGFFFINNGINVSPDKIYTVWWILHLSVATSVVYIMTTPYDAVIIAHEKIDVYAYLTILDHLLKLLIIYIIYLNENKLVFYSVLLLLVSLLMYAIYFIYCRVNFPECRYNYRTNRQYLRKMSSFAGWQFLGNTSFALTHNGLNMILNSFGGVTVNAARTIAYQVNGAINQLVSNMALVLSPFSVRSYASDNKNLMLRLFYISSRIMYIITMCAMLPVMYFASQILQFWLGIVPEYSESFMKLILVWSIFRALHSPVDTLFKSVGNIRNYQLWESITLAMPLLFSYFTLSHGFSINTVFLFVILFEIINLCNIMRLAVKICSVKLYEYFKMVCLPCLFSSLPIMLIYFFFIFSDSNFCIQMSSLLLSEVIVLLVMSLSASDEEKNMVKNISRRFYLFLKFKN